MNMKDGTCVQKDLEPFGVEIEAEGRREAEFGAKGGGGPLGSDEPPGAVVDVHGGLGKRTLPETVEIEPKEVVSVPGQDGVVGDGGGPVELGRDAAGLPNLEAQGRRAGFALGEDGGTQKPPHGDQRQTDDERDPVYTFDERTVRHAAGSGLC